MAVGQMRQIELIADEEGDWAMHCHKSHHTMNAMGHDVPTMIGVDHRGLVGKIQKVAPDYMLMGERGMADMGDMQMPIPDNTAPMMTGTGQFGPLEMGGMLPCSRCAKTRNRATTATPGPIKFPAGTVAYEWNGTTPRPLAQRGSTETTPAAASAIKPSGKGMSH